MEGKAIFSYDHLGAAEGMKILHLEDNPADAGLVRERIKEAWPDCHLRCVATEPDFMEELRGGRYDLVLSDFKLGAIDGLEALRLAREWAPDTPFIFLSGTLGEERAIEALRAGAADYVLKDRMKRLASVIERALREREERQRRRQAESRIRELAGIINQAREAIVVLDLEDRILSWNAGAERLYGWSSGEVTGRVAGRLFDATASAGHESARQETLTEGRWFGELRMHNRQHEPVEIESRRTLIRDELGRPKACLCIDSDITERKHLQEQFLRAQRMENIGLLAAGISHDLNNMLAPIVLAAPMLREFVSDPTALGILGMLEKSAERGVSLVRQILAFAHGTTGEHRQLQVKPLLREIGAVITGTFPKSVTLEKHVPPNLWPIKANPTQIQQVLLNLCLNARDAMPDGGTLRLRAENRRLDAATAARIEGARPGAFLVLHVEDTGTGMDPHVLREMWRPFYTTKAPGKGTGLGLPTVRGIVEKHSGFIEVSSAPGRGSCFRIHLPAAEEPVKHAAQASPGPPVRGHGELILLVDDECSVRSVTSATLTRHGYRVLTAAGGAEAVTILAQRAAEIRLVITDLHMPHLDGATVGRALRRLNPAAKVLVASGLSSSLGSRPDYNPAEFADGFLQKPFTPGVLLGRVNELLQSPALVLEAPLAGA
jgi:two-component system, cell cycle sensor histidine kinase and response regulator CckA